MNTNTLTKTDTSRSAACSTCPFRSTCPRAEKQFCGVTVEPAGSRGTTPTASPSQPEPKPDTTPHPENPHTSPRSIGVPVRTSTSDLRSADIPVRSNTPHSQTANTSPRSSEVPIPSTTPHPYTLKNTDGFWELSRNHETAILPQNHAWFYIAILLAEPASNPLSPGSAAPKTFGAASSADISPALSIRELSRKVFAHYANHPDFLYGGAHWLRLHSDESDLAAILKLREDALEHLLRREHELDIIKAEAMAELETIHELQQQLPLLALANARDYARQLLETLQRLHASLAQATNPRGEPDHLLRTFGAYLFHQIIVPSLLLQDPFGNPQFIHLPPGTAGVPAART